VCRTSRSRYLAHLDPLGRGPKSDLRCIRATTAAERKKHLARSRKPPIGGRFREVKTFVRVLSAASHREIRDALPDVHLAEGVTLRDLFEGLLSYSSFILDPDTEAVLEDVAALGRRMFAALRVLCVMVWPISVSDEIAARPADFAKFTPDELRVVRRSMYHTGLCPVGIACHWFWEHGIEAFFRYDFEIARRLMCEESFETLFQYLTNNTARLVVRMVSYVNFAEEVLSSAIEACYVGCPGSALAPKNRMHSDKR
jgi:hypothetical protein